MQFPSVLPYIFVLISGLSFLGALPAAAETVVDLGDLDGSNGFTLLQDQGGFSSVLGVGGGIGDVNHDGIEDFAWHGRAQDTPGESIFVVFGRSGAFPAELGVTALDGVIGFAVTDTDTRLGEPTSLRGVGDVNGDSIDDFAVGVPQESPSTPAVIGFVIYGRNTPFPAAFDYQDLDGSQGFRIVDSTTFPTGEDFVAVAGGEDIDGDGRSDLVLGSPETGTGAAFVIFGRGSDFPALVELDDLDGSNGFVLPGLESGGTLGRGVAMIGDMNGDERSELVVGDPLYINVDEESVGRAWVVFGRDGGFPAVLDLGALGAGEGLEIIALERIGDLGWSLDGGDIDGDGLEDVVLGAPGSDPLDTNENAGVVAVVYGGLSLPASLGVSELGGGGTTVTFSGASVSSNAAGGFAVAAGDVNGDGTEDFAFGAPSAVSTDGALGMVYVVFGVPGARPASVDLSQLDSLRGFRIEAQGSDNAGLSFDLAQIAGADGLGVDLLIGGSPLMDQPDGSLQGAAHVVYGAPGLAFSDSFESDDLDAWSSVLP